MLLTKNITTLKNFSEGVYQGIITSVTIVTQEKFANDYVLACNGTSINVEVSDSIKSELAVKFVIDVDGDTIHHIVYHSENGKMSPIEYEVHHLAKQLNIYGDNSMLEIINLAIDHTVDIEIRRSECGRYLNKSFRILQSEVDELANILV